MAGAGGGASDFGQETSAAGQKGQSAPAIGWKT